MSTLDPQLLILSEDDNVAILLQPVEVGDKIEVSGKVAIITAPLELGQKLAICDIRKGTDILKYGMPIGYAARDILHGEHVHVHNIASRYTAVTETG